MERPPRDDGEEDDNNDEDDDYDDEALNEYLCGPTQFYSRQARAFPSM